MSSSDKIDGIVKSYAKRLFGFIRPRVNSEEDAEDILQDVFYELTYAESLMQPIEQLTSWLFTVARNRITDLYRKKKPDSLSEIGADEDDDLMREISEILATEDGSQESDFLGALIRDELSKALSELPVEQRQVFELHEIRGKSFKEIAQITGEPVNTLLSRKRYAVIYLRQRLRELYEEIINY